MATIVSKGPVNFSADQVKQTYDAEKQLNDLIPLFDKCESCGIDISGYRAIAAGLVANLQAIRSNFMQPLVQE